MFTIFYIIYMMYFSVRYFTGSMYDNDTHLTGLPPAVISLTAADATVHRRGGGGRPVAAAATGLVAHTTATTTTAATTTRERGDVFHARDLGVEDPVRDESLLGVHVLVVRRSRLFVSFVCVRCLCVEFVCGVCVRCLCTMFVCGVCVMCLCVVFVVWCLCVVFV